MAGWNFTSTAYARGSNPITAAPFSLTVWGVLTNATAGANDMIVHICRSGVNNVYWSLIRNASQSVLSHQCAAATGNRTASTINTVSSGAPFNATIVVASSTDRRIVLDGDLANGGTNATDTTPTLINRISFGLKDDSGGGSPMDGTVFGAALWNGSLTDAEIVALSNGAWPGSIRPSGLYSFWPNFVDQGGGIIQDWCGRNPLTINAGALATDSARRMGPPPLVAAPVKRTRVLRTG